MDTHGKKCINMGGDSNVDTPVATQVARISDILAVDCRE